MATYDLITKSMGTAYQMNVRLDQMIQASSSYTENFRWYSLLHYKVVFQDALIVEPLSIGYKLTDVIVKFFKQEGAWYQCKEVIQHNTWVKCPSDGLNTWSQSANDKPNRWTKS